MKSLFKTVFLIIFFSGLTRLAGFLFKIWLSKAIGIEALGLYQISYSIFIVLLTITASGLPFVISRLTAKHIAEKDKKAEHTTLTTSLVIAVAASIIVSLLVVIFHNPLAYIFADERCVTILIALLPALIFSCIYSSIRGNLWGNNNYVAVCSAELFEQIVRILVCVFMLGGFWTIAQGALAAAVSLSIACVISAVFVLIIYFKKGGRFTKPKGYKYLLKSSLPITGVRVSTSLIQPLIALIIPLRLVAAGYTKTQAISLFGIATGMTMSLLFIPMTLIGSLSMALVPDLSTAITKQDNQHINSRISASILFAIFVSCFIIPLYMGAGENIGLFFFKNSQSGILLSSAAWIILPMSLTNITSSILNALGLEIKSFKNYIIGAVILLASIWFLPQYVGINALVWAMGLCFSSSAIMNLVMLKKHTGIKFKFKKQFFAMLAFILPTIAITSFTTNLLNHIFPLFFNLAISCSVGAIFFIILCLVFNVFEFHSVIVWIKDNNPFKNGITPRITRLKNKKLKTK